MSRRAGLWLSRIMETSSGRGTLCHMSGFGDREHEAERVRTFGSATPHAVPLSPSGVAAADIIWNPSEAVVGDG